MTRSSITLNAKPRSFITFGEYIRETQPAEYALLLMKKEAPKAREITFEAAEATGFWARLQSERPRPGRGGLLQGERGCYLGPGDPRIRAKEGRDEAGLYHTSIQG